MNSLQIHRTSRIKVENYDVFMVLEVIAEGLQVSVFASKQDAGCTHPTCKELAQYLEEAIPVLRAETGTYDSLRDHAIPTTG